VRTRSSSSPELVSPWDQIQLKFNISRKYLKISSGRVQLAGVACLRWMSPLAASKEFNKADLLQRARSASSLSLGALFSSHFAACSDETINIWSEQRNDLLFMPFDKAIYYQG
jgi:hypothetical protein